MQSSASSEHSPPVTTRRSGRIPQLLLALYAVALAAIAFWPVPVDRGVAGPLRAISAAVPWLSYDVIEVTANVLLFVPLGVLLSLVLTGRRRLVVPIALAVTILIELSQALFLEARTPSLRDIVANLVGAAIGLGIVVMVERRSQVRHLARTEPT